MQLDSRTVFSNSQAITGDGASTNHIDLGANRDIGVGTPLWFVVILDEAFNTLTSLAIQLETDDNDSFSTPTKLVNQSFLLAALTPAGKRLLAVPIPQGAERYLRAYYDVTGTDPTTGKLTAAIVANPDFRKHYAKGYSV